ncbi:MAG: ATP-binding cassette domain-containing protein [Clostridia bacterium]|nr:ATP-binding cassette domain-containing protein [Clostridia bacterium]
MEILAIENLTFTYPEQEVPTLRDLSLSVPEGAFVTLAGKTGSGKSTLMRLLKQELAPKGTRSGSIRINGEEVGTLSPKESAALVGYVMQDPERQIVTDRVWHELAFGLENLGYAPQVIAARVAETASYFGIEEWYEQPTASLSGGQKQLLNLAAVMAMRPRILLLDEPTAQLDPVAASSFLSAVKRLHRDLSITIIMAEHRLEEVLPDSNRVWLLEEGRLLFDGTPKKALNRIQNDATWMCGMPAAARAFFALSGEGDCPLDIKEGRRFLQAQFPSPVADLPQSTATSNAQEVLRLDKVRFRYDRSGPDVLDEPELVVREGEIVTLLGGNGSGKTTALLAAAGLLRPYAGTVTVFGKPLKAYRGQALYDGCLAMLPQNVQTLFLKDTVREELADAAASETAIPFDFTPLLERHPYDLSGGEQQMLAFAKVLAASPRLLLLDEPTKGLDAGMKQRFAAMLQTLRDSGKTILLVTHDVEFAAEVADRVLFLFRGRVVSEGTPHEFFPDQQFYTTAVSRMSRGILPGAVTLDDVQRLFREATT